MSKEKQKKNSPAKKESQRSPEIPQTNKKKPIKKNQKKKEVISLLQSPPRPSLPDQKLQHSDPVVKVEDDGSPRIQHQIVCSQNQSSPKPDVRVKIQYIEGQAEVIHHLPPSLVIVNEEPIPAKEEIALQTPKKKKKPTKKAKPKVQELPKVVEEAAEEENQNKPVTIRRSKRIERRTALGLQKKSYKKN